MKLKRNGCCSKCDCEVFEIVTRNPETREPLRVGAPLDNAMRAEFIMVNGSIMDLTFCRDCLETLAPSDYLPLWLRIMKSWGKHEWVATQVDNGLVGIRSVRPWKDLPL